MASISQQELARRFVKGCLDDTEVYRSRGVVATARAFYCEGHLLALFGNGFTGAEALKTGRELLLRNLNPAWGGPGISRSVSYALNLLKREAEGAGRNHEILDNAGWEYGAGHEGLLRSLVLSATPESKHASLPKALDGSPRPEPCIALPNQHFSRELCDRELRLAGYDVPDDIMRRAIRPDDVLLVDASARRVEVISKDDAKTRMIPAVWYPPNATYDLELSDGKGGTARITISGLAALLAPNRRSLLADPEEEAPSPTSEEAELEAKPEAEAPPDEAGEQLLSVEEVRELVRTVLAEHIASALRPVAVHVSVIEHILAEMLQLDPKEFSEKVLQKVMELVERFHDEGDGASSASPPEPVLAVPPVPSEDGTETLYEADPELGF